MAWPLIKYLPAKTNLRFVNFAIVAATFSVIAVAASLFSILGPMAAGKGIGFNLGIDFKGGTLIEMRSAAPLDLAAIRNLVSQLKLGDVEVQGFDDAYNAQIRFEAPASSDPGAVVDEVRDAIRGLVPDVSFQRTEVVGPKVSGELLLGGVLAVAAAIGLMMIYIWFRFEWQFGLGAVIALLHDVILTMGLFSVLHIEFTLTVIAALLTIIGYSMNDTVVIFDRLRENIRKFKKMPLRDIIDLSVNETLSRTIMTGCTTLLALGGMLWFGGEALFGFTFAILFGVIIGTYSSVYVASPVILLWGVNRGALPSEAPAEAGAG